MMESLENLTNSCPHLRRLKACLAVLAVYLWLVTLVAVATVLALLIGWKLNPFRIDAIYSIVTLHLCGALLATGAIYAARTATHAPSCSGKAVIATMPFILALSCDRLALLTYPPARPDTSAALFQAHPARLWTLRPNAQAPSLGVKLNERAMRGPLIPFDKSPGEQRVLILGDSVAFGYAVAEDLCFDRLAAGRFRQKGIQNVTIVNLSVHGYAPWQHLDLLRTEGIAYNPDLVIYAFCLNDVLGWHWRHVLPREPAPFHHERLEASGLLRLARGLGHHWRRWSAERTFPRELYEMGAMLADSDTAGIKEAWSLMLVHVQQMVEFTRSHDRRIAFLIFPAAGHLRPEANDVSKPQRRLCAFAETNGIPYLDLWEPFLTYCETPGQNPGDLFVDGLHLSARGHERAAEAFVEFLRDEFLEP